MPCLFGVGEAARAPMLCGDDLARLGLEPWVELATPGAVFEALILPRPLLDWCNILPGFIVARTVSMMHGIEDPDPCLPCGIQDLQHVRYTVVGLSNGFDSWPDLAAFRNEIIVWIDDEKCCELLVIRDVR